MSADNDARWAQSRALLAASLARSECSAWSLSVQRHGQLLGDLALGHARLYAPAGALPGALVTLACPEPVTAQHTFDWASVSKAVAGQLLVMQMVAKGEAACSEPLASELPELRRGAHARITVEQALHYTTGWPAWRPLYVLARERSDLTRALADVSLVHPSGSKRIYSDLGHLALTAFIEARLGKPVDVLFAERIAAPLGLRCGYRPRAGHLLPAVATSHGNAFEQRMLWEPGFGLRASDAALEATTYSFSRFRAGTIVGEVDDGNAHYLMDGVSAHAGLFGTAQELATLAQSCVLPGPNADLLGLTPQVQAAFVRADSQAHLPTWWHGSELGVPDLAPAAANGAAPAVMLRGFTGTLVYVEPALGLTVALLSNRQHVDGLGNYTNLRPVLSDVVQLWRSV